MLLPLQVELVYPEQGLKLSPANVVQDLLGYRYKRQRLTSQEEPCKLLLPMPSFTATRQALLAPGYPCLSGS